MVEVLRENISGGDELNNKILNVDVKKLAAEGEKIYETLREKLEPEHKGKIVAIDVDTGEYFLGNTILEADKKANKKYPGKVFHFVKVGYPAVYVHR